MSAKPTVEHVKALFQERTQIEAWLDPTPDPAVWPPKGWQVHPQNPAFLVRIVEADKLREELFGSPERDSNIILANARLAEIEGVLTKYFFPKPKPEGTQRKTMDGFVVMLKTGIKRVVDMDALPAVLLKCPKGTEDKVVDWKATLKLKEFRELTEKAQTTFAGAIIEKPEKPVFEIVPQPSED
jgi:hypothetical protein